MKQTNMVSNALYFRDLMGGKENGCPLTTMRDQVFEHPLDADWIEAFARLIQNQQFGTSIEG